MSRHASRRTSALLGALLALFSARVVAHPMPNTEIAISPGAGSVVFDIAIPESELRLALPPAWRRSEDLLVEPQRSALARYFDEHFSVLTPTGANVPHVIESLTRWEAQNPDVGKYQELRVRIAVPGTAGFDPRRFSLRYDAVIHQVPNHFALVFLDRDFDTGRITDEEPVEVGVIRYDFRRDSTPPFEVTLAPGSAWRGLRAAVALGFHHVSSGLDHLLFLASLLVVSPLRALGPVHTTFSLAQPAKATPSAGGNGVGSRKKRRRRLFSIGPERRWSLFQGWRYTARRFLGISLAFTAGHSVSLLVGAFAWVHLPRTAVEIAIAFSVLLAAIHAIRPLFAGSEWKIAAGFGLVHGLAFSETLSGGALAPMARANIVLGFNLGVEGAQLAAMASAVPLLYASRWRVFHGLRVAAMACVVVLAMVWIAQRAG